MARAMVSGAALALFVALPAHAHDKRVARTLAIEPAGEHLQVLITLRVPAGPQKAKAIAAIDLRPDGALDASERRALESSLGARAIYGVALMIDTATVTLENAELKMRAPSEDDAPIELVILARAPLPSRATALSVATKAGDALELRLLAGTRPVRSISRGRVSKGGALTVLGVPDRVRWSLSDPP